MGLAFNPFTGTFDLVGPKFTTLNLKGTVDDQAALSAVTTPAPGDVYVAEDTGDAYVYNGASWDNIGPLTGPQGEQGDTGVQGDPGTDGDPGADGADAAYSDETPQALGTAAAGVAAAASREDHVHVMPSAADVGAATAAQGTNSREWTASTIALAEAETGIAATRRAFTAQRVRQAIVAWWATISSTIATLTGTQTLTNKTLGDIKEGIATITDGSSVVLDPRNTAAGGYGSMAAWNIGANNRTASLANFTAGTSMTVALTVTTGSLAVAGADWGDAGAPTLVNGENDLLFYSTDGTTVKAVAGWRKEA